MSLSQVQYEQLDSGITDFSVTFEYISRDHVKVTVNGTPVGFTWLNNETVKLDTAPAIGDIIDIRRQTERENLLVQFQDASTITETQLDLSARQSFYLSQESIDRSEATLGVTEDGSYSANSRRITRMGDPEDDSDATTKGWVKNEYQSGVDAGVARDEAQAARDKAKKWAEETTDTLVETGKYSAKHHANKASGSAAAASTSETNAGNSEASAANSATEAGNSAFAAGTSEENAGNSESRAFSWAEEAEDVEVEPGQFSAKHHATKAEGYAAGLNVPSAAGNANKFLQQKADESGFQYVPLGTAATANVQTSPTDTTAGRLMAVGAGGLLAKENPVLFPKLGDSVLNPDAPNGTYRVTGPVTDYPSALGNEQNFIVTVSRWDSRNINIQLRGTGTNRDRIFENNYRNSTALWSGWTELYHTGNLFNDETAPGGAPLYACRAWVTFDGRDGTIIRSNNISSVSRAGVGSYDIHFVTDMPMGGLPVQVSALRSSSTNHGPGVIAVRSSVSSSVRIYSYQNTLSSGLGDLDLERVYLSVIG